MKLIVKIAFLITIAATFSCKKGKSDLSGTYQLKELVPINITIEQQKLTVTASNINDSRCPANSQCIWEGFAATDLSLKFSETETKTFKLCTGGCNVVKLPTQEVITLNGIDYQVQLKDVVISTTSNQKSAVVTLIKI